MGNGASLTANDGMATHSPQAPHLYNTIAMKMKLYRIKKGGHFVRPWRIRIRKTPAMPFKYKLHLTFPNGLPDQQAPFFSKWGGLDFDLIRPMSNEFMLATNVYKGTLHIGIYHHPPARFPWRTSRQFPSGSLRKIPYEPTTPFSVSLLLTVAPDGLEGSMVVNPDMDAYWFFEKVKLKPGPYMRYYNAYYGGKPPAPQTIIFSKEEKITLI